MCVVVLSDEETFRRIGTAVQVDILSAVYSVVLHVVLERCGSGEPTVVGTLCRELAVHVLGC